MIAIFLIGRIVGLVIGTPLGFILCTMLTANNHADDCHVCSFSRQNDELRDRLAEFDGCEVFIIEEKRDQPSEFERRMS